MNFVEKQAEGKVRRTKNQVSKDKIQETRAKNHVFEMNNLLVSWILILVSFLK